MMHDMVRRFAFIETRLFWGDGLSAGELAAAFGIARPNAQQTIAGYRKRHPRQMRYDRALHRQIPTDEFKANYIREDVGRFLDYQRAVSQTAVYQDDPAWLDLPFTDADAVIRPRYDKEASRAVLAALRCRSVVEVEYWSKQAVRVWRLSPHHLVFADGRYHLRAYCHDRQSWLDFVLSRIMSAFAVDDPWVSDAGDRDWHARGDMSFLVNSLLPDHVRDAIRLDYLRPGLERLVIPGVRKALSLYIRRRLCRPDAKFGVPLWVAAEDD